MLSKQHGSFSAVSTDRAVSDSVAAVRRPYSPLRRRPGASYGGRYLWSGPELVLDNAFEGLGAVDVEVAGGVEADFAARGPAGMAPRELEGGEDGMLLAESQGK